MRDPLKSRRYVTVALLVTVVVAACAREMGGTPMETAPDVEATSQAVEQSGDEQPLATYTPYPTHTPYPTYTPAPTATPQPTHTPLPAATATHTPAPTVVPTVAEATPATGAPTEILAEEKPSSPPVQATPSHAPAVQLPGLTRIPDTDPGPPFTILIDTIHIRADGSYKMAGAVRNDGSETYESVGVHASFVDSEGWGYGPFDVYCPCAFLEPGAQCPFSMSVSPKPYVEYHLHPLGRPVVNRQPAPVALGGIVVANDGVGNVRITGTARNDNPFPVKDARIAGALIDAGGRIVSAGGSAILGEIAPGASAPFDVRIEYEPYVRYQLYAQATQQ